MRSSVMTTPSAKGSCFVISPIGEDASDTRKRSDQILDHVFRPAAKQAGYEDAVRADEIDRPGIITSQIIEKLVLSPVVLADLTERNANVFYELSLRHALRETRCPSDPGRRSDPL